MMKRALSTAARAASTEVPSEQQPCESGGEIWMKGPNVIRGYWNKPEATAETIVEGWLRSGDLGRMDEDGFIYIEDRAKDMILRGGENVYCAEVEVRYAKKAGTPTVGVVALSLSRMILMTLSRRPGRMVPRMGSIVRTARCAVQD